MGGWRCREIVPLRENEHWVDGDYLLYGDRQHDGHKRQMYVCSTTPTTTASHDLPIIKLNTIYVLKSIRTYPTRRARPQCPFVGRVARLPHTSAHPFIRLALFLVLLLITHLLLLALFLVLFFLVLLVHKWTQWITRGVGVGMRGGGEPISSSYAYLHVYSSFMALHLHLHVRRRRKTNATRMARSRRRRRRAHLLALFLTFLHLLARTPPV